MKKIVTLALFILSITAYGQGSPTAPSYSMAGIEAGFKSGTANVQGATSDKQATGYQLGVSGVLNFNEKFGLKSGLFYSEKSFKSDLSATTSASGKISYVEVPAFLMYKIEEYAGVYAGPSLALKMGDDATPSLQSVKSMITPLTFGVQFKFLPQVGLNLFFESAGQLATGVEQSRSVGANIMFTLD